jgi:predicted  nucleic acid-binding Zn-ribbon protein
VSPELIASFGGLLAAIGALITGVLATRSKVKLDDIAKLHAKIDELETDLTEEKKDRDRDADTARAKHSQTIADYEAELAKLKERLRQRDQTIGHLDRVILALRTYVARARRKLVDHELELPAPVDGMDD